MSDETARLAIVAITSSSQIILSLATLIGVIKSRKDVNTRLDGFQSVLMDAKKKEGIAEGLEKGVGLGVSKTVDVMKEIQHPSKKE